MKRAVLGGTLRRIKRFAKEILQAFDWMRAARPITGESDRVDGHGSWNHRTRRPGTPINSRARWGTRYVRLANRSDGWCNGRGYLRHTRSTLARA